MNSSKCKNFRLSLGLSKISMGYSSLNCPYVSYMTPGDGILKFYLQIRDGGWDDTMITPVVKTDFFEMTSVR